MKFQPKRFVVEVKRGTSRASFASPDPSADRFSNAEAMLFGTPGKADAKSAPSVAVRKDVPSGRVLRSLVEPPPPVVEDMPPPARRGRKPGSKNKPKPPIGAEAPATSDERPRRGRKPGSKNKPKLQIPTAFPPASTASRQSLAAAMRSYGFADDGTVWPALQPAEEPAAPSPVFAAPSEAEHAAPETVRSRVKLRERSTILKRYVLGIEPRPGQPGALRMRRLRRAS